MDESIDGGESYQDTNIKLKDENIRTLESKLKKLSLNLVTMFTKS